MLKEAKYIVWDNKKKHLAQCLEDKKCSISVKSENVNPAVGWEVKTLKESWIAR